MEHLARQTYIYLALEASLRELGMEKRLDKLGNILASLIQEKMHDIMAEGNSKYKPGSKLAKYPVTAAAVLDSEFPFGKHDHQKFQAVLYGLS
jgi:hypothetical protein